MYLQFELHRYMASGKVDEKFGDKEGRYLFGALMRSQASNIN